MGEEEFHSGSAQYLNKEFGVLFFLREEGASQINVLLITDTTRLFWAL